MNRAVAAESGHSWCEQCSEVAAPCSYSGAVRTTKVVKKANPEAANQKSAKGKMPAFEWFMFSTRLAAASLAMCSLSDLIKVLGVA